MRTVNERSIFFSSMLNNCARNILFIFLFTIIKLILFDDFKTITFSVKDILGIIIIGISLGCSYCIFYIKKNNSIIITIIIEFAIFILLDAILLAIGFFLGWFEKKVASLISIEMMYILSFFVTSFLVFIYDVDVAKRINKKLKERKKDNLIL